LIRDHRPDGFIDVLRTDYTRAPLSPRERAILDYAAKLTLEPAAMRSTDLEPMREQGLSDRDILDANLVTAYYAYVNRIADGLGVSVEGEQGST
jgi:uncharacterized peroxidase-related enzyme